MIVFEPEITQMNYAIAVDIDDFKVLTRCESYHYHDTRRAPKTLFDRLEAIEGVSNIEYNGHFGANLFVTIDAEIEVRGQKWSHTKILGKVRAVYERFIKDARKFLSKIPEEEKNYLDKKISE